MREVGRQPRSLGTGALVSEHSISLSPGKVKRSEERVIAFGLTCVDTNGQGEGR